MLTFEQLQAELIAARKNGDTVRRDVLADIIATLQTKATANKVKVEITPTFIESTLISYEKMAAERVNTCPANRTDLLTEYQAKLNIVKEYAPKVLSDKSEIRRFILGLNGVDFSAPKGVIMKTLMPQLKGKCDMKVANEVISDLMIGN